MKAYEKLLAMRAHEELVNAIRRDLDPKFDVRVKEFSRFGRVHSWFAPNAAVILGHTCYVPEKTFDSSMGMAQLMAHEGTHIAQKRDFGVLLFNWLYAYPISFGLVIFALAIALLTVGVLYDDLIIVFSSVVCCIASVFCATSAVLARPRAIFELEAFATSWWYFYAFNPQQEEFLVRSWITGIRLAINSGVYLWCGKSIGIPMINSILLDAARGEPAGYLGRSRDHTVKWFLTSREILLDARLRRV